MYSLHIQFFVFSNGRIIRLHAVVTCCISRWRCCIPYVLHSGAPIPEPIFRNLHSRACIPEPPLRSRHSQASVPGLHSGTSISESAFPNLHFNRNRGQKVTPSFFRLAEAFDSGTVSVPGLVSIYCMVVKLV